MVDDLEAQRADGVLGLDQLVHRRTLEYQQAHVYPDLLLLREELLAAHDLLADLEGVDDDAHEEVEEEEAADYHKEHEECDPPWVARHFEVLTVARVDEVDVAGGDGRAEYVAPAYVGRHHEEGDEGIADVVKVVVVLQPVAAVGQAIPFIKDFLLYNNRVDVGAVIKPPFIDTN